MRARPGYLNAGNAGKIEQRAARDNFLFQQLEKLSRDLDLAGFLRRDASVLRLYNEGWTVAL